MAEIHMGGLVSGIDTQGIIDKLLEIEAKPIEAKREEKTEIEADIAAWAEISAVMTTLTDALDTLRGLDTWRGMTASSSDTSRLSASAGASAEEGACDIIINKLAQAHSVSSARAADLSGGADAETDLVAAAVLQAGDQFTLGAAGPTQQTVTIGATESLSSLRVKINNAAESMSENERVHASILDNRLVITRVKTGDTDIVMADSTGSALDDLDIYDTNNDEVAGPPWWENELLASQDAEFLVNTALVTRSSNTGLTDVIEGVTLNLLDADPATTVKLSVSRDTQTAKTAILDFITAYNDAVEKMEAYRTIDIDDSPAGDSTPVVGELQNDALLRNILYNLRKLATESKYPAMNALNASYTYDGKTGVMDSLDDIGVSTSGQQNKLAVQDEDRLDSLLATHFDEVQQLFRGVFNPTAGRYENGVAGDLYAYSDGVSASLTGSIARHTTTLTDQIEGIDASVEKMLDALEREEQHLWEMFGAMEDAIAEMQQELSWLTSQLGGS